MIITLGKATQLPPGKNLPTRMKTVFGPLEPCDPLLSLRRKSNLSKSIPCRPLDLSACVLLSPTILSKALQLASDSLLSVFSAKSRFLWWGHRHPDLQNKPKFWVFPWSREDTTSNFDFHWLDNCWQLCRCTFHNGLDRHGGISVWWVNWRNDQCRHGHHNQQNQPNLVFFHFEVAWTSW